MVNMAEFKRFFIFNLVGSLIIAALVAVVTVLVGEFTKVTERVLLTLFMVVLHSIICLGFIWDDEKQNTFEKFSFFSNALFLMIVISFLTSIFGIWEIIPSNQVTHIYQTFFVFGFAALHGDILSKALDKENYIDWVVYLNYLFMAIVVAMIMPWIFMDDALATLGQIYFRFLAAAGIIDGTLSILTIIFYKLYMYKHPKVENILGPDGEKKSSEKKGLSIWVWILLIYLFVQIVLPLFFYGLMSRY